MIGEGAFRAQVARVRDLAGKVKLLEWPNLSASYPTAAIDAARNSSTYRDEWKTYVAGSHYDVQLIDGSLIQFKLHPDESTELSYCYYDCPLQILTYQEFVKDLYGIEDTGSYTAWDEYEQYRAEQPSKPAVTPLRYDYSPQLYREGVHPASHLHVGYGSEIRIGLERILGPFGFMLLVLRLAYPHVWESQLLTHADCPVLVREWRENLEMLGERCLKQKDKWDLMLK